MSQRCASVGMVIVGILCAARSLNAEQVTVTGSVTGPDGAPVTDAQVMVTYRDVDGKSTAARAVSDADGSFSFSLQVRDPERSVQVAGIKEGLALNWGTVKPGEQLTLELGADPVACAGVVTGPDGEPIAGAQVWVRNLKRKQEEPRPVWPTEDDYLARSMYIPDNTFLGRTSDARGTFEIGGLSPDGFVHIAAEAEGRAYFVSFDDVPPDKQDVAIVLQPEAVISGRVTHKGEPVPGVRVFAQSQVRSPNGWGEAKSGADGTYAIRVLPASSYNVMLDPPEGLTAKAIEGLTVEPGEHFAEADLELTPGGVVQGTVLDARTGKPVADAWVGAYGPARPLSSAGVQGAQTDEAGRFTLRLPEGENRVYTGGLDYKGTHEWIDVVEGQTVTGANFILQPKAESAGTLRGRVVGPDGQPVAGVKVGSPHGTGPIASDFEGHFTAESDLEGNFELHLNRIGEHDGWPVLAMEPERGLAGIKLMPADKLPEEPVQITVSEGGYVTATILDTEGKPIPDVPTGLSIFPYGRGIGYGMSGGPTDENGRITIGPLPIGPTVYVGAGGKFRNLVVEPKREKAFITPGGNHELEPIVLNLAGRSLVGWVTDERPQPIKDAIVCVSGQDEPVRTDDMGKFELTGLPAVGMIWIVAMHPTEPLFAAQNVDPDWDIEPSLILRPTGSAEGRIINEAGEPIAGAKLRGYPWFPITWDDGAMGGLYFWQRDLQQRLGQRDHSIRTVTDAEGKWRVEGLIGGAQYRFRIELPDGTDAWQSYEFIAEPDVTTDAGEVTATPPPK